MGENETRKPDAGSSTTDVTPATSPQAPDTRDPSAPPQGSIPPPPSESLFELVAEAAFVAVATALLGSIPAALRVARAGGSFLGGWIVSASVVVPVLVLLIYLSHAAGRGFRMLTGQGAGRSTALGLALWAGLLSPVLMFFSSVLKEKTNHRGLGGATFGVVALALAILMALVARRLVSAGRGLVERGASARAVAVGFAAIAVGPLLLLSLPLLRHTDTGPHAAAIASALIDGLILAVATAVAVSFGLGDDLRAKARRIGLPTAGAFVILGFGLLTMSQHLGLALRSGGGLAAALLGGLERWTDRDGDGAGALFGGADCDEGDPRRHPGAIDIAGDGIDQDCDGVDGAPVAKHDSGADVPAAAAATAAADTKPAAVPLPTTRPSIVLVTLDTVRADWTSAFGYKDPTTPRLEALAKRGTAFGAAYAPGSDTQRAFIHLFSGRPLEDTAKDRREWPTLKDENITVAERLKDAGYLTAGVSSFQWISKERGFAQGFEQFVEVFEEDHPERGTTGPQAIRAARAFLEKTASDPKPVFLWVHLFDAHSEYRKKTGFDFGKGEEGAYRSEIGFVDKQLGDLIDAIDASPRAKSTAIIVHGSQGEAFDEHGSTGHGKDLHAEVLHVPLVIALPGDPGGGRRLDASAVSTADIPATIVALGQASPEGVTGSSLLSLARGEAPGKREPVYARASKRFAVIDYPLKLILQERKGRDRTLLFDLAADPGEKRDLSEQRADDLNRLSALLRERFKLKVERDPD
ncbi:MAG: sulfatase-like hydrolase/transferase [Polyangiaceae bacterium]|nr:sulfatase-like hydrolase/transferase [Polyangiaceae bacterium]